MLRKIFKKINNKAFTLIEILLAVGLLAIASVSIGAIIISTQNNTTKMFSESELQQQMVEVQESLHNEFLATNEGIGYWTRETKNQTFERNNVGDPNAYEQLIAFYNLDTKDYILNKTYYKWNSEDKTLHTATIQQEIEKDTINDIKVIVDKDLAPAFSEIGNSWSLVASNVEKMSVDLTNYNKNRLVSFSMEIKQGDSSYPIDDTIYLRNTIDVNQDTLTIEKYHVIKLPKPTLENTVFVYDGKNHGPTEIDYLERYLERTSESVLVAKDAGTYVVTYKLKDKDGTKWEDGSTTDVTLTWVIQQRVVGLVWGETTWIYDGQVHYTTCRATNVVEGDTCEIRLANNSVGPHVGTVECTAACVNKNYTVPNIHTVTLKIQKAQPTVTINVAHKTYSGSAQSMVSYSNLVGGTLRFYISTSSATPAVENVKSTSCTAINAGTYHIWYKIVADDSGDYSDTDVFYLGTAKMNRRKNASASALALTYNTKTQTGVTGSGVNWEGTTSAKNAGTYNAYATPDSNHLWPNGGDERRTVTWTIDKAVGQITAPKAVIGLVYNGSAQTLVTAGSTNWGYVVYKIGSNGTYSSSVPKATDAGTYTIYYYSVGDSNHYPTSEQSLTVEIARQRTAYANGKSLVYNGKEQNGVNSLHVSLSGTQSAKNVGTYTYKATPLANYAWSDGGINERSVNWYITKAEGSVSKAPTAKTLTYNGNDQTLVNAGQTSTGEMYYSLTQNGSYSTTIPTGKNAGTYTVYYYSKGDDNHSDSIKGSVNVTIARKPAATASAVNKVYNGSAQTGVGGSNVTWTGTTSAINVGTYKAYATPTSNYCWSDTSGTDERVITWYISKATGQVTPPTAKDLTYNGSAQTLINAGSSTTGTMYYKLSGGSYSTSLPSATDAGTYTVYYYSKGGSNYQDTSEASITVTINRKRDATASGTSYNYNGSTRTGATGSNVDWRGTRSAKNVGNYTAYATPIANHAWSDGTYGEKTISWSINAVGATVTKAPTAVTGLTYNGSSQTLVNAGTASGGTMYYKIGSGSYSTSLPAATDAGTYTIYYYVKGDSNHTNSSENSFTVTIACKKDATVSYSDYTYNNGSTITGVTGSNVSLSGTTSAINVGTYTAYATPSKNHAWSDGKTDQKTITWKITLRCTQYVTVANRTYTGSAQNGYSDKSSIIELVSGDMSATNAGSYSFTMKITNSNYAWTDGSTGNKTFSWTMSPKKDASASAANKTYNGKSQTGVTGSNVSWSGTTAATNAGTHTAYATPSTNHAWSDGTTSQKTITWTMSRLATASASKSDKTYNGSSQTGVTGSNVDWSGTTAATNAGTHTAYATPKANYAWSDGTTGKKTITWTMNRSKTASASGGTYNYTGSSITGVTGSNVDWSGTTSASASGTHTAYATPKSNYAWSDGGTGQKTITWKINGYIFKVGNSAITRSTCQKGCSKNGIYSNGGNAMSHSNCAERLSTDKQKYTIGYIWNGSYHDSVNGPTSIGAYALHPKSNTAFYHPTSGKQCTSAGWTPAENSEA